MMKDLQRKTSGQLTSLGEVQETEADGAFDDNSNSTNGGTTNGNSNGSPSRLPAIPERRTSVVKKRTSSFNEGSLDSSQRRASITSNGSSTSPSRRASIPQGSSAIPLATRRNSRPLFASIGRRVSTMVRARLAFQRRPSKTSSSPDSEPDNSMEVIHELPRNPRFSSFMSPEAQYAMMKGYEDKLYEDLAGSFPESALSLKRNRTPHQKISIRGKSASRPGGGRSETIGEGSESGTEDDSKSGSDVSSSRTSPSHLSVAPAATRASTFITSSSSPSSNGKSPDRLSPMSTSSSSSPVPTPSPFLRPIGRRQSVHVHTDVNGNAVTSSTSPPPAQTTQLHRSHSLPVLAGAGVPHDRRLVLSYRLESAMDILDTIRRRKGEYSLSPRVYSKPRPIVPVRDFNSWTAVWEKEFKEVPAKS